MIPMNATRLSSIRLVNRIKICNVYIQTAKPRSFLSDHDIQEIDLIHKELLLLNEIELHNPVASDCTDCDLIIVQNRDSFEIQLKKCGDNLVVQDVFRISEIKSIVADYLNICSSYEAAAKEGGQMRLETLDMGRRSVHNEAAAKLMHLSRNIRLDAAWARLIFSLFVIVLAMK